MRRILYGLTALIAMFITSCKGPQKTIYFRDNASNDPTVITQRIDRMKEAIVQPDDILSIHVATISSMMEHTPTSIFNDGGTSYNVSASLGGAPGGGQRGYLVDPSGYIDFPVAGKVKVGGLTIRQVKEAISTKLKNYVKDPVVEVGIMNYKIVVLGEVAHPGTIIAPNHKISVIDAIAAAGDIPITGRKDNVTIIRETEGVREFAHINLNSKESFTSPYFYLKQNDIVYVEPARIRKQEGSDFFRFYLPAITSLMSTLLAIYGIVQLTNQ